MVTGTPTRSMLDALMDAGYSLRDAAAALNLSATDLLDASEAAQQPLAALDRFSRQVAELQVLDSRMQALKALVKVCNDTTDLEKKRLAAQAILRFDPWRAPRAAGNGGRSHPPRSPRESRESHDNAAAPLPVPHTPSPRFNGETNGAVRAHVESTALPRIDTDRHSAAPEGHAVVARPEARRGEGEEPAAAGDEPLGSVPGRPAPKGQANSLAPPLTHSGQQPGANGQQPGSLMPARAPPPQSRLAAVAGRGDLRAAA